MGGAGAKAAIDGRCRELRKQIEETKSDYDKEKLRERLAKLTGGVALIRVGALSEAEAKKLREAFEDAISATKAAVAEGILPDAGLSLLLAIDVLDAEEAKCEEDEKTGLRIFRRALEAPTRQIAENSAMDGGVVIDCMRSGKGNCGLDASTGKYVDLIEAGIIDATKVVRIALENALGRQHVTVDRGDAYRGTGKAAAADGRRLRNNLPISLRVANRRPRPRLTDEGRAYSGNTTARASSPPAWQSLHRLAWS